MSAFGDDTNSSVGDGDEGEDESIAQIGNEIHMVDEAFILGLSFLVVLCCKLCGKKSSAINPLERGPYARSIASPCLPWMRGTYSMPKGSLCRICVFVFGMGGFGVKFANEEALSVAMRGPAHASLSAEFQAASKKFVELVNRGVIRARMRGSTRSKVTAALSDARHKALELINESGVKVKAGYRAVLASQYEADGGAPVHEVGGFRKMIQTPDKGMQEVARHRANPSKSFRVSSSLVILESFSCPTYAPIRVRASHGTSAVPLCDGAMDGGAQQYCKLHYCIVPRCSKVLGFSFSCGAFHPSSSY
jgi:hypothetical protein